MFSIFVSDVTDEWASKYLMEESPGSKAKSPLSCEAWKNSSKVSGPAKLWQGVGVKSDREGKG